MGTQVVAVVDFPPKRVSGIKSKVLAPGVMGEAGVALPRPDAAVADGARVG